MDVAFFSYRWKLAVSEPLLYNILKKKQNLGQVLKDTLDLLLWYRIATISFVRREMLVS